MTTLDLTVQIEHSTSADELRWLLQPFEQNNEVKVNVTAYDWSDAWQMLLDIANGQRAADVSQVGSTWVGSLIATNALMLFNEREIRSLGGEGAFSPRLWQTGVNAENLGIYAIPWLGYAVVIYYRKDWLAQVGVDAAKAFQTPQALHNTLQQLQNYGIQAPWHVPTLPSVDTVHFIHSWLWQADCEFVNSPDSELCFAKPNTLASLKAYFDLYPFLSPQARHLQEGGGSFAQGQVAVTMSGPGLCYYELSQAPDPSLREKTGAALPFNCPMIGASHLVIWKRTRQRDLSVALIHYLTSLKMQQAYLSNIGLLPVRMGSLDNLVAQSRDELENTLARAMRIGRSLPAVPHWGDIEEKLTQALGAVWEEVLSQVARNVQPDIEAILLNHLNPLAELFRSKK